MLKVKVKGNWDRTDRFFKKSVKITKIENIVFFAEKCIERLREETPKDSGVTADSWSYKIETVGKRKSLYILNSNIQNGIKIVLLIEFGHATPSGSWVEGKNFIAPATQDVYNEIINKTWKELKKL
ncbi:MAG: HK97 gp10 family phage protein [Candidatus Moranbacteria bacterium]|nr:HK97 gp10 family phage protein [Candidatus Moranbacteria bacterium]